MNRPALNLTTEQLFNANRAAIRRSVNYDNARLLAASLPSADRLALAIWLVDHADGLDPDERNHAVDVLGGLV